MFYHRLDAESALSLREKRHSEELFALTEHNRERLREWLPWLDQCRTLSDTQTFIREALEQFGRNRGFSAGIWHQGALAGVIGFHGIDWPNRSASLGYWIDQGHEGKGLISLSVRAMTDHAFGSWQLNRMVIRCATANLRSRAIPERLGFTLEGTLRQAENLYGSYVDLVVYGILASEWAC